MKTFELYVPAGWVRLDLTDDVSAAVSWVAGRITASAPIEQRTLARAFVRSKLAAVADALAGGGAVCMVLPVEPVTDMPIRPLIVAMPLEVPAGTQPMDLLLSVASADATAELIDVDGLVALRTRVNADLSGEYAAAAQEVGAALEMDDAFSAASAVTLERPAMVATRVRYLIGEPADPERWVDLFFTVEHPDHPAVSEFVDATISLFDAQVRTFRWTA